MPIEPNQFILYWAVGMVVLILIVFRRPRRTGMRLRLTGGGRSARGVTTTNGAASRAPTPGGFGQAAPERSLNVIFQFNGHSWDAYEVLGLPAGSNYDSVRAAFEEALESVDPTSRPFVEAAFRAITTALKA